MLTPAEVCTSVVHHVEGEGEGEAVSPSSTLPERPSACGSVCSPSRRVFSAASNSFSDSIFFLPQFLCCFSFVFFLSFSSFAASLSFFPSLLFRFLYLLSADFLWRPVLFSPNLFLSIFSSPFLDFLFSVAPLTLELPLSIFFPVFLSTLSSVSSFLVSFITSPE